MPVDRESQNGTARPGVLHNLATELSRCATMCVEIEAAISDLVQASAHAGASGSGLQQIDRLGQILADLSRVTDGVAGTVPDIAHADFSAQIETARLHEVRERLATGVCAREAPSGKDFGDLSLF